MKEKFKYKWHEFWWDWHLNRATSKLDVDSGICISDNGKYEAHLKKQRIHHDRMGEIEKELNAK